MSATTSELLLDTARRGELHHAIVLHGPSPTTLRATALAIAKTIECLNHTTGDDCTSCRRVEQRLHPDVHFVEVGDDRKMISVEQVREVVNGATMRPYEGRGKVFIIDPADAISVGGSNAMLKTLEEPPRDTFFVLLTRSYDLLLPTIKSRCQQILIPGKVEVDVKLRNAIIEALNRFATNNETVSLLTAASLIAGQDDVKSAIAIAGDVLAEGVANSEELAALREKVGPEKMLAAADGMLAAIRWLGVNADARLLVEQALAALV
jgi:DNA polymerase III gamma/tau subunit